MAELVDIVIPIYKPDADLDFLIEKLEQQSVKPGKIILMNTEKKYFDDYIKESHIAGKYHNIEVYHVSEAEFDHGKTRNEGILHSEAPYFLCMTQDAVPADEFLLEELLKVLKGKNVAVVYGRQQAKENSHILEEYTRKFNYPDSSRIKSKQDIEKLGIKTYFCSNACAMYQRSVYDELGGFLKKTIFNEDMIFAAAVINAGYEIGYVAEAKVIHSHHYTGRQQFHRNFDLGVSQADHPEVFQGVPSEKEGGKLVKSTILYLWNQKRMDLLLPFLYQCGCKYLGYRMGKSYQRLPEAMVKSFSMNQNYWKK